MRDYEKMSREHFDKQAPVYDETNTMYYSAKGKLSCKDITDFLADKNFARLLDVGCGTGYLIQMLSEVKNVNCVGLDLSQGMIDVARKKNIPNAEFVLGKADELPFEDESFDIVTCSQSFHHYPNRVEAVEEAYRVLKKGGLYILSDTGMGGLGGWLSNHIFFKLMKSGDCYTQNRKGIEKLMESCGFRIADSRQLERMVYTVTGKKPWE